MRLLAPMLPLLLLATQVQADDWPQWLGPHRDGVWRETGIIETFPEAGPKQKWSVKVGGGYAGPAVANGKVVVMDRQLAEGAVVPDNAFAKTSVQGNERVLCLDSKTGKELWKHEYPCEYRISYAAGPRSTPTIDGDKVYTIGAMGDLFCLNMNRGQVIWSKNFLKDYESDVPVWGFAGQPLVDGEQLICVVGGSKNRLVVSFDKATGKELWTSLSCPGDFGYAAPMIYTLAGKRTLVIWHTQALAGIEPETGMSLWMMPFQIKAALTAPTPMQVGDDKIFVTSFYNGSMLVKIITDGAEVIWKSQSKGERPNQTKDLSSIIPTPMIVGDYVYGVGSYGELRCLKVQTGERIWATMRAVRGPLTPDKVAASDEPSQTQPWMERWANAFLTRVGDSDTFWLFNEQGVLIIAKLTPDGYSEISRAKVIEPTNRMAGRPVVWSCPAFAEKCVFVRNDKELICLDVAK